jgi:hypothetical protein
MLLPQPELAALRRAVVGIEHPRQRFALHLAGLGIEVGAAVECPQVEGVDRLDAPQPQRVDRRMAVPGHQVVVRHRDDVLGVEPVGLEAAVLDTAAEADAIGPLGPLDVPRIGLLEPSVGLLHLPAVGDLLAEHAVFVADAVADAGQPEAGGGVEEAGREPPEPAVAECRAGLERHQLVETDPVPIQRLAAFVHQPRRHQGILQFPCQQKLHRQIGHLLEALLLNDAVGLVPAPHQTVANRQGGGPEPVARCRFVRRHPERQREALPHGIGQCRHNRLSVVDRHVQSLNGPHARESAHPPVHPGVYA